MTKPDRAGVPEDEVEITPEMIEAGVNALHAEPFIDLPLSVARNLIRNIIRRIWKVRASEKAQVL